MSALNLKLRLFTTLLLASAGLHHTACAGSPTRVETIYSNIGTGQDKYGKPVWVEYGRNYGDQIIIVFAFTPAASYTVTEIQVAAEFAHNLARGHVLNLILAEDDRSSGESAPGKKLFETRITKLPKTPCCKLATVQIPQGQMPAVRSGKRYWLELIPAANTDAGWYWNATRTTGIQSISTDLGKTWQDTHRDRHPNGTFAVYGIKTGP